MPQYVIVLAALSLIYWAGVSAYGYRQLRSGNDGWAPFPPLPSLAIAVFVFPIFLPIAFGSIALVILINGDTSMGFPS